MNCTCRGAPPEVGAALKMVELFEVVFAAKDELAVVIAVLDSELNEAGSDVVNVDIGEGAGGAGADVC